MPHAHLMNGAGNTAMPAAGGEPVKSPVRESVALAMRYLMRQKWLSFGDDYTIKNERGEDVFFVDGHAFSIGDKLSFQDMAGNELAFIRQRLLTLGKTYDIDRNG